MLNQRIGASSEGIVAIDPVELIRVRDDRATQLRCANCGVIQTFSGDVPAGGVDCCECGARLNAADTFEYAGAVDRLVAFVIDLCVAFVISSVILALVAVNLGWLPKDEDGMPTRGANLTVVLTAGALLLVYYIALETFGDSPGRHLLHIRVVRSSSWQSPGIVVGIARATMKMLSVAALGLGFVPILFDLERRCLHDWIARTLVIVR